MSCSLLVCYKTYKDVSLMTYTSIWLNTRFDWLEGVNKLSSSLKTQKSVSMLAHPVPSPQSECRCVECVFTKMCEISQLKIFTRFVKIKSSLNVPQFDSEALHVLAVANSVWMRLQRLSETLKILTLAPHGVGMTDGGEQKLDKKKQC